MQEVSFYSKISKKSLVVKISDHWTRCAGSMTQFTSAKSPYKGLSQQRPSFRGSPVVYLGWPIAPPYMSPNAGGWVGGGPISTVVHMEQNELWISISIFNKLCLTAHRKLECMHVCYYFHEVIHLFFILCERLNSSCAPPLYQECLLKFRYQTNFAKAQTWSWVGLAFKRQGDGSQLRHWTLKFVHLILANIGKICLRCGSECWSNKMFLVLHCIFVRKKLMF